MKKIIVAGAGHGGLIVATNLAKKGFDVTVIEQKKRKELGYDWTDVFNIKYFIEAGINIPKDLSSITKYNMTFYPPNLSFHKKNDVPIDDGEIKMERKQIYDILIDNAIEAKVKFVYGEKIIKSIIRDNRVLGIETNSNNYYGDLIIDACGVNSPIRCSLDNDSDIEKELKINEKFYVYRAFYNNPNNIMPEDNYRVYLMPHESKGVSWVAYEKEYIDVLIGKFERFDDKIVKNELKWLRKNNKIGFKKLRGGDVVEIPIRRPINQMVYNGYVAIGDSAFMTIPLMGSGIANSARAANILVNVLIKNKDTNYNIDDLWDYQVNFYKNLGYDLAYKDILKETLINLDYKDINFIFESNILNDDILLKSTNDKELKFKLKDIIIIAKEGFSRPKLLLKLIYTLLKCKKISRYCKNIPRAYSYKKLKKWKNKYLNIKA